VRWRYITKWRFDIEKKKLKELSKGSYFVFADWLNDAENPTVYRFVEGHFGRPIGGLEKTRGIQRVINGDVACAFDDDLEKDVIQLNM